MTDVKLFTHAFSANVLTESAHLKHDGLITPWNFYKYNRPTWDMYRAAQGRAKRKKGFDKITTEKHQVAYYAFFFP